MSFQRGRSSNLSKRKRESFADCRWQRVPDDAGLINVRAMTVRLEEFSSVSVC